MPDTSVDRDDPFSGRTVYILYHFFYPDDVISARLYSDLAFFLADKGCRVTALPSIRSCHRTTLRLSRSERIRGVRIRRLWRPNLAQSSNLGRIINTACMLLGWTWQALWLPRQRREVVIVGTDPVFGVLAAIPWRLFRPSSKIVHWCHDVHPEATVAEGTFTDSSPIIRLLKFVLRRAYRRCDAVVDLGSCMRQLLIRAGGWEADLQRLEQQSFETVESEASPTGPSTAAADEETPSAHGENTSGRSTSQASTPRFLPRMATLTPWSLVEPPGPLPSDPAVRSQLFPGASLGLLYSGNLGRAHAFEPLLELARALRTSGPAENTVQLCFAGRGIGLDALRGAVAEQDTNISFAGFASEDELALRLAACDIHMVSLKESWTGTVVPSKFFGALAIGRPVLFAGSSDCALAKWINEYRVGWVLDRHNCDSVCQSIIEFSKCDSLSQQLNARCWQVYQSHFSQRVQLQRWAKLLSAEIVSDTEGQT